MEYKKSEEKFVDKEDANFEQNQSFGWFNLRPKACRVLNSTRFLLLLMCGYFTANSTVVNGLYSTSISTIEQRFSLSSSRLGVVTSIYDVAALIFTGPVSYFGVRKKPVTLGIGMITMGIGYLVFISPHFIADEYIPVTGQAAASSNFSSPLVCASASSRAPSAPCSSKEGSDLYYGLFLIGMFIAGAGCTPMLAVGIPFLDENVSKRNSPLYIGILQTSGIIAAVIGFLLSSVFLGIFVHPNASVTINKKSPSWIGAWWLGFAIGTVFAFIIGILLTGFPQNIRKGDENKNEEGFTNQASKPADENQENLKANELLSSLKTLLIKSPTFLLVSSAVSVQSFLISGGVAFNAKIALFQYRLTASEVSVYYGLSSGVGAFFGNLAGSYILKRCQFSTLGILKFSVIVAIMTTLFGLNGFLYCDTYPVPGVNTPFPYSNTSGLVLNHGCNSGCSCKENMFVPLCSNGFTYVNPCNAGCRKIASAKVFSNCSCVSNTISSNAKGTIGLCQTSCGILPTLYFVTSWFLGFAIMFNATPCTMATLRCVPPNLRSFAMGLQWMLVRVLGSIPGPILFGHVIDNSCLFWMKKCSNSQGTCTIYNNKKLAMGIGSLMLAMNVLIVILISLAYVAEKRKVNTVGENQFSTESSVMEVDERNKNEINTKL